MVLARQSAVSQLVDDGVDVTVLLSLQEDITLFHVVESIYSRSAAPSQAVAVSRTLRARRFFSVELLSLSFS